MANKYNSNYIDYYGGYGNCGINPNNKSRRQTCVDLTKYTAKRYKIKDDSDLCIRKGTGRCVKNTKRNKKQPLKSESKRTITRENIILNKCIKTPKNGGYSINELRTSAKILGINTHHLKKKEICDRIVKSKSSPSHQSTKQEKWITDMLKKPEIEAIMADEMEKQFGKKQSPKTKRGIKRRFQQNVGTR